MGFFKHNSTLQVAYALNQTADKHIILVICSLNFPT